MRSKQIPLSQLLPAEWNANRVAPKTMRKIRRSLEQFGVVENLVARPHPDVKGSFEVISGNHRLQLFAELGHKTAPVVVVELDDAHARLLAQTLNRTRGADDPEAYARLLENVLQNLGEQEGTKAITGLLPETEASLEQALHSLPVNGTGPEDEAPEPPAKPDSKPGRMYELGAHRLLCGDATSPEHYRKLFGADHAALMATDPPYGVSVDHTWRDGLRQPIGAARTGKVANDDRADWREAWELTDAPVAYVWHSALHGAEVEASLLAVGFVIRQQIIWSKTVHVIGRAAYQWKHEPCWYAVRKGGKANWRGGRDQSTVWEAASPIMAYGGGQEERTPHPTQKPVALFERPILNHTKKGDIVYDPFGGSGTSLIAAERTGRRCYTIELDPAYCDVIRQRYEKYLDAREKTEAA